MWTMRWTNRPVPFLAVVASCKPCCTPLLAESRRCGMKVGFGRLLRLTSFNDHDTGTTGSCYHVDVSLVIDLQDSMSDKLRSECRVNRLFIVVPTGLSLEAATSPLHLPRPGTLGATAIDCYPNLHAPCHLLCLQVIARLTLVLHNSITLTSDNCDLSSI